MKFPITVCSYHRPDSSTLSILDKEGIRAEVWVCNKELEAYRALHPDHDYVVYEGPNNICQKRRAVVLSWLEKGADWLWNFDDDVTDFQIYRYSESKTATAREYIEKIESSIDDETVFVKGSSKGFLIKDVVRKARTYPAQVYFYRFGYLYKKGICFRDFALPFEDVDLYCQVEAAGLKGKSVAASHGIGCPHTTVTTTKDEDTRFANGLEKLSKIWGNAVRLDVRGGFYRLKVVNCLLRKQTRPSNWSRL